MRHKSEETEAQRNKHDLVHRAFDRKDSTMNRWLMIGAMAALLIGSTGCRCASCGMGSGGGIASGSCSSGGCGDSSCGSCSTGSCGDTSCGGSCGGQCGGGVLGHVGKHLRGGLACGCGVSGCRGGCQAGGLGWQQGGLDYSSHLQPGLLGHRAGQNLNSQPFTPGPPTAQVGYPYYTHRGPRDFLMANPPSIGR